MGKEKKLSDAALAVLSECEVAGSFVKICGGQLDRKLYEEVDLALRGIGGKWDRRAKGHSFAEPEAEVREMLEGCIQTGIATPLHPNGFFMTQPTIADYIVALADIQAGDKVLEPSAGEGAIVRAIVNGQPNCIVDCIELNPKLAASIDLDRCGLTIGDFLALAPKMDASFDRVVMNPPFIFLSEIDHIKVAWGLLKAGGRLVSIASSSITFRREKRAQEFREFIAEHGHIEELPDGAFKDSGTMVRTVIVVLNKTAAEN